MKKFLAFVVCAMCFVACNHQSAADKYRAEKHIRDSVSLIEQQRSLDFYQAQLDSLLPVSDSLLTLFKY